MRTWRTIKEMGNNGCRHNSYHESRKEGRRVKAELKKMGYKADCVKVDEEIPKHM